MFEAVKSGHIRDVESGIAIHLVRLPDYAVRAVITCADGRSCNFYIERGPKFRDKTPVLGDRSNPTIFLYASEMERLAKFRGGSIEENTKFVRLILDGLSTYNRLWPLMASNAYFYRNREKSYQGNESKFSFVMPTEEEIAQL